MGTEHWISETELNDLAVGAWILGTGGGGDPYYGLLGMKKLQREGKRVRLIQPEELDDGALVAVVSQMGAPLVSLERLADANLICKAVRMMEDYLGRPFSAVMTSEIGGNNAFQPFLAAALLGLPVVDADPMGRAFPGVQYTSFAVRGLSAHPLSMADVRNNGVILTRTAGWLWSERISRKITMELGSRAFTCKAPRTGREVKDHAILHSVSKAMRIGRTVREARQRHEDPVARLVATERGLTLFKGKVQDVLRRTTDGFLRGTATLQGLDGDLGSAFVLEFQNEFLVGRKAGRILATVPELICVLDSLSGEAIGTESLRYGQRVTVIALPAPEIFLSPEGLAHTGPRAFGYDFDFHSVFSRERA